MVTQPNWESLHHGSPGQCALGLDINFRVAQCYVVVVVYFTSHILTGRGKLPNNKKAKGVYR